MKHLKCTSGKTSCLLPTEGKVLPGHRQRTGCSKHNPRRANRLMPTAKPNELGRMNSSGRYGSALGQLQSLPRGQLITSFVRLQRWSSHPFPYYTPHTSFTTDKAQLHCFVGNYPMSVVWVFWLLLLLRFFKKNAHPSL